MSARLQLNGCRDCHAWTWMVTDGLRKFPEVPKHILQYAAPKTSQTIKNYVASHKAFMDLFTMQFGIPRKYLGNQC